MALRPNVAKLREALLRARVIDEYQMRAAMGRLEQFGGRLTGVIVDLGFCDEETMAQTVSKLFGVPRENLGLVAPDRALLAKVDVALCDEHCLFPMSARERVATIAVSDPSELDTIDALSSKLGMRVKVVVAGEYEIKAAIARHYRGQSATSTRRSYNRDRERRPTVSREPEFELDDSQPLPPQTSKNWRVERNPSANTLLDEFLDSSGPAELTAPELKRLADVERNQQKAGAILLAVQTLLIEKGYLR